MKVELKAHPAYYNLSAAEKAEICNGMGAKDSFLAKLIPNTMYGLDVSEAGNRHDLRYHIGQTEEDKRIADREFLENLLIIINNKGGWLAWLRRRRALKYYEAVYYRGHDAFWANKIKYISL